MKKAAEIFKQYKLPLLILVLGVSLMLLPASPKSRPEETGGLGEALSMTQGVGEAYVLISESGVVVVCDGADNAETRLKVIAAAKTYTGFGADHITVLKKS